MSAPAVIAASRSASMLAFASAPVEATPDMAWSKFAYSRTASPTVAAATAPIPAIVLATLFQLSDCLSAVD